jgi:hypothetical protein
MADPTEAKARKAVRRTHSDFEKGQDKLERFREARRYEALVRTSPTPA